MVAIIINSLKTSCSKIKPNDNVNIYLNLSTYVKLIKQFKNYLNLVVDLRKLSTYQDIHHILCVDKNTM